MSCTVVYSIRTHVCCGAGTDSDLHEEAVVRASSGESVDSAHKEVRDGK